MAMEGIPMNMRENKGIILVGYVGLGGSLKIAKEKEEELGGYFSKHFMNQIKKCEKYLMSPPRTFKEESIAIGEGIFPMKREALQKGGDEESMVIPLGESCSCNSLWSALWNLCERWKVGVEVEFSCIPIRQETIEVCQYFDLNPYQLSSKGSYLMVTSQEGRVMEELERRGITAKKIGEITEKKERIIKRGDYIRHLPRMKGI